MIQVTDFITIYTPTFNRAFCLPRVYDSLKNQEFKNFTWLIIDDGSSDETSSIVETWIAEGMMTIKYILQENKGMLGAHNTAHQNLNSELAICIDSDDHLAKNVLQQIFDVWENIKSDDTISGIIGLDAFEDGEVIGLKFPKNSEKMNFFDTLKYHGDKKYVFRSDLLKRYGPYPEITNEKFPAQSYIYRKIGVDYKSFVINEVFCIVEYLEGGNSANKMRSYKNNPKGFKIFRELCMEVEPTIKKKFRNAIHYVSSCIFSGEYKDIFFNRYFYLTIPASPFGLLLNYYISKTKSKSVNKKLKVDNKNG